MIIASRTAALCTNKALHDWNVVSCYTDSFIHQLNARLVSRRITRFHQNSFESRGRVTSATAQGKSSRPFNHAETAKEERIGRISFSNSSVECSTCRRKNCERTRTTSSVAVCSSAINSNNDNNNIYYSSLRLSHKEDIIKRRRRKRRVVVRAKTATEKDAEGEEVFGDNSDWLDETQELLVRDDYDLRARERRRTGKRRSYDDDRFSSQTRTRTTSFFDELREFVEPPPMKMNSNTFANGIFDSATEMKEMLNMNDDDDDRTTATENDKDDDERNYSGNSSSSSSSSKRQSSNSNKSTTTSGSRRRRKIRERRRYDDTKRTQNPFVLAQIVSAFSYVTNAIVSALESVVPESVPLFAIRASVYGLWALLAVSSAQRFLVLLACTGGVLLLFGAMNAGLSGVDSNSKKDDDDDDDDDDSYYSGSRKKSSSGRGRTTYASNNNKQRDFDATRTSYERSSKYRTRSNPRWGRTTTTNNSNNNTTTTMSDELIDLEIPYTDFVSENINRVAKFGGDTLRDLGISFDGEEDDDRSSKEQQKSNGYSRSNSVATEKGENKNNVADYIDVTLVAPKIEPPKVSAEKKDSSFTVGYREWLSESNASAEQRSTYNSDAETKVPTESVAAAFAATTKTTSNPPSDFEEVLYDDDDVRKNITNDVDFDDDDMFDYAEYKDAYEDENENDDMNNNKRNNNNNNKSFTTTTATARNRNRNRNRSSSRDQSSRGEQSFASLIEAFVTGRFYGQFQEDRVRCTVVTDPMEDQEDRKNIS
jgi:hypothetical protein